MRQEMLRDPMMRPPEVKSWSRLQVRMSLSYVWMTVFIVLLLELLIVGGAYIVVMNTSILNELFPQFSAHMPQLKEEISQSLLKGLSRSGPGLLILMTPVGMLFGILTTRGLVQRLQRLAVATTHIANGEYSQRVPVGKPDEIGVLEVQFNRMAQQLSESIAQQQRLSEQNARLEERNRIARDLHDSVKQQLFAISMQLGAALTLLQPDQENVHQLLTEADTLTYDVRQELTTLIQKLRPSALQERDLPAALRDYVTTWGRQHAMATEIEINCTCQFAPETEEALLRITQEALSNIARHSQANHVKVTLTAQHELAELTIADNGRGFAKDAVNGGGVGLHSMRERMAVLGGKLLVESKPGEGTRIIAQCACSQ